MSLETSGIHHVTAIASDPQANLDFYTGLLGLRLVKRTVNFDDPGTYHFYFGDEAGRPGSLLTFFPWPGMPRGRAGPGMVTRVRFAAPPGALEFWHARLTAAGVALEAGGRGALGFGDPDGLPLAIHESGRAASLPAWPDGPVAPVHALRALEGVTIEVTHAAPTLELLTAGLGFRAGAGPSPTLDTKHSAVEVIERPGVAAGRPGAGTVHHVAWRARDEAEQLAWREALVARGLGVTPVRDRCYFRSIYFFEPGGVLYEIATDGPGFALDEPLEALGTALKLPDWLEPERARIERALPTLRAPSRPDPAPR